MPEKDDKLPFDQPLLEKTERVPVEGGLIYLGLIITGLIAVVGWLVWKYTGG